LDEICFIHYSKPRIDQSTARAAMINGNRDDLMKRLKDTKEVFFICR
jgi:hypothetical protein